MAVSSMNGYFQRAGRSVVDYFKRLGNDYMTVAKDTIKGCKDRPIYAGGVFAGMGFLTYAYVTNPSKNDLYNLYCEKRQQMVLIPLPEHNPKTDAKMKYINLLMAQDRLHYYNIIFFSLLVKSDYNDNLRVYSSQESLLRDWKIKEFWNNIIDVGYLGKWHNLDKAFVDYDINYDEIDQLPN